MLSQELVVTAFTTFFVTIDPIGVVPIFLSLTATLPAPARRAVAIRGILVATAVLVVFAVAGDVVLRTLGISLPAFRIAGGLLLLLIAAEMLFERRNQRRAHSAETLAADEGDALAVFPLAVPLLAGPGAITAVVLLMSGQTGDTAGQAAVLATLLAAMGLTGLMLLLAARIASVIPPSLSDVVTRLLGILLAALAVQFVLDGVLNALRAEGLAG